MRFNTAVLFVCLGCIDSVAWSQAATPPPKQAAPSSRFGAAVDETVLSEIKKRHVSGLSLAIIEDGKIVKAQGYGTTEKGGQTAVTVNTLFQAGSISKPVSALGALRLVQEGKLALDEDVNTKLITWKVPRNEFTKDKKVTLRGLLSHTAGLTVHGFPGYATDEPCPTVVQILDGAKPTNTSPIRVDILPGSQWRYSGGGYTIMQQLVVDVTGKPFPQFMQETVLEPLDMKESTFEQPLPDEKTKLTATGHTQDRNPVKGRWHIYPEMAAAGLWTTTSDLARFAIGVQEALAGKSAKTLSPAMARQMLTEEKNNYGLGVSVEGSGTALRFGHGGRDQGFDARLVAHAETGQGAAIMINANDNSGMQSRILEAIAREYRWRDYPTYNPERHPLLHNAQEDLHAYTGRYEFTNNRMLTFAADRGRLFTMVDGLPDEEFLLEADNRFRSAHQNVQISFTKDADGTVSGLLWQADGKERKVPRIGPLFHYLKQQSDPDPARTEKVVAALKALGQGGNAVAESSMLTPGARADFGTGGTSRDLADIQSVVFLAEQDVVGRNIERHKGEVSRVLHYRLVKDKDDRFVLVHLTADGLITDYDIVTD
jgi:CubicO group peptidase (beta-lactamase class C family)